MPDFTSVLYLGMHHDHGSLRPWQHLTTGRPAALGSSSRATRLAARLAGFMGHDAAALGASSLHLFWDLFDGLTSAGTAIHMDAGTYPIARWGIERARWKGARAISFLAHDANALRENLARCPGMGRPVVVSDALSPLTGRSAPLREYVAAVRAVGALLVVDDTQGLGIFGRRPCATAPYGRDGAGTPAWCGIGGPDIVVVSSLAKAFGAPLAVLAGSATVVDAFEAGSQTRVHCSPPSLAAVSAAEHALALNAAEGSARRGRLLAVVDLFRRGLREIGLAAHGGLFPFQTLTGPRGSAAVALHGRLLRQGVRTVLHRTGLGGRALVTFVLNCLHSNRDIAVAIDALDRCRLPDFRMRMAS